MRSRLLIKVEGHTLDTEVDISPDSLFCASLRGKMPDTL